MIIVFAIIELVKALAEMSLPLHPQECEIPAARNDPVSFVTTARQKQFSYRHPGETFEAPTPTT